jgi:hypothetical protein
MKLAKDGLHIRLYTDNKFNYQSKPPGHRRAHGNKGENASNELRMPILQKTGTLVILKNCRNSSTLSLNT